MTVNSSGGVEVSLQDSPFHRLLLHATCQFYGMKSKSVQSKANQKLKVTVMSPTRRVSEVATNK
eukprot:gene22416-28540_t